MEERRAVAGYFRVSKARDGMQSPDIYRDQIERYCAYKGMVLGEIYSDIDHSGYKRSRSRPALAKLVEERAAYSAIVVPKLSRFGRDLTHLAELFDLFDREQIALVFLDLGLDTSSSQGRLLRNLMASIAEYESDVKSDYSRASARHVASQGRPWAGTPPYGYFYDKREKNYFIDETEAAVVREMFSRLLRGDSMGSIVEWLTDEDIPSRHRAPWKLDGVRRMLDNPAYAGLRPFDGQLITATWEPLLDMETWRAACEVRDSIRARFTKSAEADRNVNYLLRGVMECGVCGKGLVHRPNKGSAAGMYVCPDSSHFSRRCPGGGIATQRAEELVIKSLRNRLWYAFADDVRVRHARLNDLEARWTRGDTDERRSLLKLAIARVVLVPRPPGASAYGKGLEKGRRLRVVWADGWEGLAGESEEIVPREAAGVTKWCNTCGAEHPLSAFNRDGSKWDGYQNRCRACVLARRKERAARIPISEGRIVPPRRMRKMTWAEYRRERLLPK